MLDEFKTERLIVVRDGEGAALVPGCLATVGELLDIINAGRKAWFWKWRAGADRVHAAQSALRGAMTLAKLSRMHDIEQGADQGPLELSRNLRVYWPLGYPQNARFLLDEEVTAEPDFTDDTGADRAP